ncbi:sigma-E factor negative regulatory protein [Undibacterium cyanobacteriorum]|uniref:Sigma-E factor negative regulatory protein n=1 Tax=Undibacterium cyanobacteriorum TaxID=3073561 RepID=A0ABY9RNY2_9BURK|nr:sigma-E factor negative regulatory protein [Undibacterium sp. 20NA77.5]WMW82404.1 sigma-E factor negative regulatory protein [Undibacterium sp. 20NA77.5]
MDTSDKLKQQVSQAVDGDLSEEQLSQLIAQLRTADREVLVDTWNEFHMVGDLLRSDELSSPLSTNFSAKVMQSLDSEPILVRPPAGTSNYSRTQVPTHELPAAANAPRYLAITSIAAAVMVAFVMAPQIIASFNPASINSNSMAKNESSDSFSNNVRLASNSRPDSTQLEDAAQRSDANNGNTSKSQTAKETEFAQKLENQVEMLRDPRLDSYLQAHQKVSPTFDSSARHIQRANVVPETNEK